MQEAVIRLGVQLESINREMRDNRDEMRTIAKNMVSRDEFKATLEGIDAKIGPLRTGVFAGVSLVATGFFGLIAYLITHAPK